MKFTITINNNTYEIEISKLPHERVPSQIKINGETMPIAVSENWDKEFPRHFILNNEVHEAEFEYGRDGFPKKMWLNSVPCKCDIYFPGKAKLSKDSGKHLVSEMQGNVIRSPMPGKIVEINVEEGQKVSAGEVCLVLEAMKMENELEAQKSGLIKSIRIKKGESVEIDQILIILSDEDDLFY